MEPTDLLDCLERTLNEIDVLAAIFGQGDDEVHEGPCIFSVSSQVELERARSLLEAAESHGVPTLELEIRPVIDEVENPSLILRCQMPPGYPENPLSVYVSVGGLKRAENDRLSAALTSKAEKMVGQEAVMDLVEEFKKLVAEHLANDRIEALDQGSSNATKGDEFSSLFGRRWIWVHHISDSGRRKSIVAEAEDKQLSGFLKSGYPGIVIVEGKASDCDEFVAWIKGNKSRPRGFGRNWGHHVRGHVNFPAIQDCRLPTQFQELEDLAILGKRCRELRLQDEFLEYVMQHRGTVAD